MEPKNRLVLPERNPLTHAKHRREVFWQIIFPMLIGILLVLVVVAVILLSATHAATNLSRWADVSLIWLIMPSLFFALIILIALISIIYLITVVLRITPGYARILQNYFEIGRYRVSQYSNRIVEPILKTRSTWAILRHATRLGKQPPNDN
jgi:uncharacterized BrkB/YihY/UPF0761 family membrane protein